MLEILLMPTIISFSFKLFSRPKKPFVNLNVFAVFLSLVSKANSAFQQETTSKWHTDKNWISPLSLSYKYANLVH